MSLIIEFYMLRAAGDSCNAPAPLPLSPLILPSTITKVSHKSPYGCPRGLSCCPLVLPIADMALQDLKVEWPSAPCEDAPGPMGLSSTTSDASTEHTTIADVCFP